MSKNTSHMSETTSQQKQKCTTVLCGKLPSKMIDGRSKKSPSKMIGEMIDSK